MPVAGQRLRIAASVELGGGIGPQRRQALRVDGERLAVVGLCLLRAALAGGDFRHPQVEAGGGRWQGLRGFLQERQRLRRAPLVAQGPRQALPGLQVAWLQLPGLAESGFGLLWALHLQQQYAQVVGQLGAQVALAQGSLHAWVLVQPAGQGALQQRQRLFMALQPDEGFAEAEMRVGVVRLQFQRLLEGLDGLGRRRLHQRAAQAGPGAGRRRVGGDHMAEEGRFVLEEPHLLQGQIAADRQQERRQESGRHKDACRHGPAGACAPASPEPCQQAHALPFACLAASPQLGQGASALPGIRHRRPAVPVTGGKAQGQPLAGGGGGAHQRRQEANARQILIAVGNEGEPHVAVVGKAEHGQEGDGEEEGAGQGPPPDAMPRQPEGGRQPQRRWPCQPVDQPGGANVPMGVDDQQRLRPQQFAGIEPERFAGNDQPLGKGMLKADMRAPGIVVEAIEAQRQAQQEEGRQLRQVPLADAPLLPPDERQQGSRQGDGDCLAQQGGAVERQQRQVAPGLFPCSIAQPAAKGQQVEAGGQQVLAGGDPSHRLGMHRMQRKEGGHQPGARRPHAL